jgi:hypothetical protein
LGNASIFLYDVLHILRRLLKIMPTKNKTRLFVVSVAAFMLVVQLAALYQSLPGALRGSVEFRSLYTAAVMVRIGHRHEIYDRESSQRFQDQLVSKEVGVRTFDRPAYEAMLFVPFALLQYRTAYVAFFGLNVAFLALAIVLLRPYLVKLAEVWNWAPAAVFVCFFPVVIALVEGEDSIVLLTLLVASAVCFYRGQDLNAGVLLGLTLFKWEFSIPIALLFLLWRRWRLLTGFCIVSAASTLVSVWLAGPNGFRTYARLLLGSWNAGDLPSGGPMRSSDYFAGTPNLRCLLNAIAPHHFALTSLSLVLVCFSILLVLWAATKPANFALAILVAVLVSSRGLMNDAAVLVVPIAMVLDSRLAATSGRLRLWSRNIVCLLFVGPSLLFLAGLSYCWLGLPMLFLLMPLRSTSDSPPPDNNWFKIPARLRAG